MSKSQRIRAIFENNVSKMLSPEQQEYEDWKRKQHQEKTKSGETAAGIRRGQHVTPGNKADQVYGGRDHMGYLRVTPAQLKGQRLRMSLQHHVDRLKGSNPELADRYRNLGAKRGMQLASTDHYRAGIKTLFESILNEILKNPRRRGDLSAKPTELTRTPIPYPELVSTSRQLRADLKTAKEGGLRALAGLAGEKPDPEALADEDKRSVRSSVAQAHASLSGSHKLGQTDAATRRLLRLPPAKRPTTAQSRAEVERQDREDSSVNYYREGLKALFESVLDEVSQRAANKAYWEGEGKDFKGAGRKLANLTKKFQAKQGEKSPFRTPNPNDPSDWGIDPIPAENVNVKPKGPKKPQPDQSDEKMRSPHFN